MLDQLLPMLVNGRGDFFNGRLTLASMTPRVNFRHESAQRQANRLGGGIET
jgi:hypothetical protein